MLTQVQFTATYMYETSSNNLSQLRSAECTNIGAEW